MADEEVPKKGLWDKVKRYTPLRDKDPSLKPAAPPPPPPATASQAGAAPKSATERRLEESGAGKKAGGSIKRYAKGGGIEVRGKTRGKFI